MGEVVNLRRARKAQRRAEDAAAAEAARLVHGRSKAERDAVARDRAMADRHLDGHRRDESS